MSKIRETDRKMKRIKLESGELLIIESEDKFLISSDTTKEFIINEDLWIRVVK